MQFSKKEVALNPTEQSLKVIQDHQADMRLREHNFDQEEILKTIALFFSTSSATEVEAHLLRTTLVACKDPQFYGDAADLEEKIKFNDSIVHLIHEVQKFVLTATVPQP